MILTREDIHAAWSHQRGDTTLVKGKTTSPGLPVAPKPSHERAPRPDLPKDSLFDPTQGVAQPKGTPYAFKPHRLKDLRLLHLNDSYDKVPQHSAHSVLNVPELTASVKHMVNAMTRLRPGWNPTGGPGRS